MAHVIFVSALGPNPSFFLFLGGLLFDLGQGLGLGLGPGLDNMFIPIEFYCQSVILLTFITITHTLNSYIYFIKHTC